MSTIIVTGASRGLGYAITNFLLASQANVIGVARDCTNLEALAQSYPGSLKYVTGDVCNPEVMRVAVEQAETQYGRLDSVVYNAGVLEPVARVADAAMDEWRHHFEVNFFSIVSSLQLVLPQLRLSQGRIIMISSGAATKSRQGWSAYSCSKAAMNQLVRDLQLEEKDVTSVAVRPGTVDTDMQRAIRDMHSANMDPMEHASFVALHERGQLKRPDEVAEVIGSMTLQAPKDLSGQFINWEDYNKLLNGGLQLDSFDATSMYNPAEMTAGMQEMPLDFTMAPPAPDHQSRRKRPRNSNADDGRHLFACEQCGERFTRHENLKRHQRNHDDSAIERCPKCSVTCKRHDLLKRHVKKFHQDLFEELFPPKVPNHQQQQQQQQHKSDDRTLATTDAAQTLTTLATPGSEGIMSIEGIGEGQSLSATIHPQLGFDPAHGLHRFGATDPNLGS